MLSVKAIFLYKNGVAHIVRSGQVSGTRFEIPVKERDLDDALKSMAFQVEGGKILSIEYDSIRSLQDRIDGLPAISPGNAWSELVSRLQGREVEVITENRKAEGRLVGIAPAEDGDALLIFLDALHAFPLKEVKSLHLKEGRDLLRFLEEKAVQENSRILRIRKEEGEHAVHVHTIVPASLWRISYRILTDSDPKSFRMHLAAFAIFENPLDEKLEDVRVTLTTGLPVSFRYNLKSSFTPIRPEIHARHEELIAPPEFVGAAPPAPPAAAPAALKRSRAMPRAEKEAYGGLAYQEEIDTLLEGTGAVESLAAEGSERTSGGVTRFDLKSPVTLEAGGTACVPLFVLEPEGERRYLYNKQKTKTHPVLTLMFKNPASYVLESGPVTLYETGEYAGESILPFTPPAGDSLLAFSQELSVSVTSEERHTRTVRSIRPGKGYFRETYTEEIKSVYFIRNRSNEEKILWLEHGRRGGKTDIQPGPDETDPAFVRYRIVLTPDSKKEQAVVESWESYEHVQFDRLPGEYLELHESVLDKASKDFLQKLIRLRGKSEEIEAKIQKNESENRSIREKQEQVRKNLSSLTGGGEEAALRGKLVQKLSDQENRLEKLDSEKESLETMLHQNEDEIRRLIESMG